MAVYTKEERKRIWERTDGRCHLTGKHLKLKDYGVTWEIDHSKPVAKGGANHGNNYFAASISANRSKQARSSRSVRRDNGLNRSPMSRKEQEKRRDANTLKGAAGGAAAGAALLGALFPPATLLGAGIGGLAGALLGNKAKVE